MTGEAGTFRVPLKADVTTWQPGRVKVQTTACAPPTPGTYRLALHLPDTAPTLANNPAYAIRLANVDTWDPATGLTDLGRTIEVSGSSPWLGCSPATR